jgi:uroporphyrinogen-III synthase
MSPQSPRLILTRPDPENASWLQALSHLGAQAVAWPLIDILPTPQEPERWRQVWATLSDLRAVMFVSRSAVQHFFARRPAGAVWPIATRAWCTGPGTRRALIDQGLSDQSIDAPPQGGTWDTEHLWPVVTSQVAPGHRFLFVRGTDASEGGFITPSSDPVAVDSGVGRDWLAQQVQRLGGHIIWVVSYVRSAPKWNPDQIAQAQSSAGDGSVWVFSSSQAVAHLGQLLPGQDWRSARAVATHERIARRARELGFGQVLISAPDPLQVWASLKSLS